MQPEFRIISTLGPASAREAFIAACVRAGQACFRLNGSHMSCDDIEHHVALIRRGAPTADIYLDLQGGKRRIGALPEPLDLADGARVLLVAGVHAAPGQLPVPFPELFRAAREGDALLLQDGAVRLRVEGVGPDRVEGRIERGGLVRGRCGLVLSGRSLAGDRIPEDQQEQLRLAARLGIDHLALSYAASAGELERLRAHCDALGYRPRVVAKIERPEAVERLAEIARGADELWFCRGDLGTLVPLARLGALQDEVFAAASAAGCPLVIAGQVFHHLTEHAEPTRSEVVHLHDIRRRGAAGVVLSDETAIGRNPIAALEAVCGLL